MVKMPLGVDPDKGVVGEALRVWKMLSDYNPEKVAFSDENYTEAMNWIMSVYEEFINKSIVRMYNVAQKEYDFLSEDAYIRE